MPEGAKLVREENLGDLHLRLYISDDQCEASFQFKRIDPGCTVAPDFLKKMIVDAGVVNGMDENRVMELAEACCAGSLKASEELVSVARGKRAVQGTDGRVEFLIKPSAENVRFNVTKDEAIDYKNTNLIQNVLKEQHLATVHQPGAAEEGRDLFGNAIPTRAGQPVEVHLGPNAVMEDGKIYSQVNGRFVLENDILSVNPVYQVRGDVDYTVGNVNFIGLVQIQKDVLDDFSVFGKEGVEVNGVMGAANVESEGHVTVNGGVNGKGRGYIRALGAVRAKYFNEVSAVCREDVEVAKSIMNSTVKTKGKLICPMGNVIGGSVVALMGIDVGSVGSDLGVETSITAGVDYEIADKIATYEAQIDEITREIERIDRVVGPVLANKQKLMALSPDKKKALKGLLEQLKKHQAEQGEMQKNLDEIRKQSVGQRAKEILVRKMLYSGVKVCIGHCRRLIKMEVRGPIRLREDAENETISIANLQG